MILEFKKLIENSASVSFEDLKVLRMDRPTRIRLGSNLLQEFFLALTDILETARDQRIHRGIKSGRTWMVEDGSRPGDDPRRLAATVTCGRGGNRKLWTQRERNEPALYISRLIVARRQAGRGVGASLINWAGLRGRDWDAQFIRIDVWTTNHGLQNYYKAQGFRHVRTYDFDDPWDYPSAALFQKPTNEIDLMAAARFLEVWPAESR